MIDPVMPHSLSKCYKKGSGQTTNREVKKRRILKKEEQNMADKKASSLGKVGTYGGG